MTLAEGERPLPSELPRDPGIACRRAC